TIENKDFYLDYEREENIRIYLPEITAKDVERITNGVRDIHELSIEEITDFLSQIGDLWSNKNYDLRREAEEVAAQTTGYHRNMIARCYDMISRVLNKKFLIDLLETEIGDLKPLDEWIKTKETILRAIPIGRVLHIAAGNVPAVSVGSFLMGVLTKNSNIIKVASGDPATFPYIALTFKEIDKNHPIIKTTSVLYWSHNSPAEDKAFEISNAICVWGGFEAVTNTRRKSRYRQNILEFGPRRSIQLISKEIYSDEARLKKIASQVAYDLVLYDQQACHSPQIAYVEKPAEKFCRVLASALEETNKIFPKGFTSLDEKTNISHERETAVFRGDIVYKPDSTDWTIILTRRKNILHHPLSRILYVVEVNDIREAIQYLNEDTMVVAFSSKDKMMELKDEISLRGVDRLTTVGRMGYFQIGHPHEGRRNLVNLLKWVGVDQDSSFE
ncbi:MAG TPA: hypothetical protein ENG62_02105, partial [Thermoplasmatales archaeon]|nr:hypothetical protein [Thermoplasmatales archaeon]